MKILKKILIGIVALIAILLIVAAIAPKKYEIEKEIVINKPRTEVFNYIKSVKNQDNYGVWQLADPQMKKSYDGTDGTVGFKYSWESEKMGNGTQTITLVQEGERFETDLDFGFGTPAHAYFITKDAGTDKTTVIWGIKGETPFPFNIMNLVYDMGDDFEQGLNNLKAVVEK